MNDYCEAIDKIKAVLNAPLKVKVNLLSERTSVRGNDYYKRNSNYVSSIQFALTNFCLIKIVYTNQSNINSNRIIEPFALLSTQENWLLVAYCRLRSDFRYFRLDRVNGLEMLSEKFIPHKLTLLEFFKNNH